MLVKSEANAAVAAAAMPRAARAAAMPGYRICTRCVMDTTDPQIRFDPRGVCSHCRTFDTVLRKSWFPDASGQARLREMLATIRRHGEGAEYDCIMGLSGGVDSSYLAYKVKEWQLRPLIVHIDAGWNSELAVKNIENMVKKLDYDLYTHVVDWEEMKDLHVAFLRARVANQDVPQDHVFFATLRHLAIKHKIRSVLTGSNIATESILPASWGYNAMDARHLVSIHKRFGCRRLESFNTVSFFQYCIYYPYVKHIRVYKPLNLIPYNKGEAKELLRQEFGWQDYGGKHYESRFTKFFQSYYLPEKFGYDKRRAHLSSLIVSGQTTRDQALAELERPLYDPVQLEEDREFVLKKLGLEREEFDQIMQPPNKSFRDYPSNYGKFRLFKRVRNLLAS